MQWKVASETAPGLPGVVQPKLEPWDAPVPDEVQGDWLCVWCLNRVANEKNRFCFNGQDEFTFSNPEDVRFEIITFSETRGCDRTGTPTLEHTWFPGHAWSYCQCGECGQHLGWFFNGNHEFAALIKTRIVRAVCVRN